MSETPQTGYQARTHHKPVKRYCQTLDLRDDPALIAEYRRLHSEQGVWREILDGIRSVGILEMEIYLVGTRLFMKLYDKDTGALKETYAVVLKSDGDGTKFLNDQGEYSVPPTQERGTVVFFSSGISSSVSGKGMAVKKSSLKPAGITPVVGKDIVIQVDVGVIGLITSSDLQNYYLSYENGTLLQCVKN